MDIGGMRSYPKQVVIGESVWEIKFVRRAHEKLPHGDYVGWTDEANQVIRICKGQSRRETFTTFIHEVIHAFESEGEFELPHHFVFKLEKWLADFIVDNCCELAHIVSSGKPDKAA